ncbi:DJ-1/PfpI family protein [Parvibaculum sp.]|uniref:DJ-1/PfpI family protein n=1 Tax=Parvibaculum sp. TaxID=2024848 RepID=UPI002CBBBF01|nr:DJ-1/PfpI family protein [Parvibaculum sp.]HUD52010.1 DJ-1/PfpI family protein [Parvibaculum sp.]
MSHDAKARERTIGILIFDDAEELDFVGPYEVFTMSNEMFARSENRRPDKVLLISETGKTVTCAKGMRVEAHCGIADAPKLDLLLVPGGQGTRTEVNNKTITDWVARVAGDCEWVTSVCTGSMVLTAAGPAKGKRVTTHWAFIPALRERGEAAEVVERVRYIRDGNVVTSAGVSAGIDMALWLVGQMHGEDHARFTQMGMQYDPAPPYAAAV